jgi:hypothetical protein
MSYKAGAHHTSLDTQTRAVLDLYTLRPMDRAWQQLHDVCLGEAIASN